MGPNQTFKSLCKEKHKQNEKTYGTGKNVCKWCDWQGVNIQNIQTHTTQYLKTKKKKNNQKVGRSKISPKKTYRWWTDTWKGVQHR